MTRGTLALLGMIVEKAILSLEMQAPSRAVVREEMLVLLQLLECLVEHDEDGERGDLKNRTSSQGMDAHGNVVSEERAHHASSLQRLLSSVL